MTNVLLRADDQRRKFEVDGEASEGNENPYIINTDDKS